MVEDGALIKYKAVKEKGPTFKLKLDYGWKQVLRGMRHCLRRAMDAREDFLGRHHWSDDKLFNKTRQFMVEDLGFNEDELSNREVTIVLVILNPCKGIMQSKKKGKNQGPSCDRVAETLS